MTHPTTEQSIREWLARALWDHVEASEGPPHNGPYDEQPEHWKDEYRGQVDAILAELQEPSLHAELRRASKGMLTDVQLHGLWDCVRYIRDGGK